MVSRTSVGSREAFGFHPRRNRCFQSSVDKFGTRPEGRTPAACWLEVRPAGRLAPSVRHPRATCGVSDVPLTDGRDTRVAHTGQGTDMGGPFHNERGLAEHGLPARATLTVSPRKMPVNTARSRVIGGRDCRSPTGDGMVEMRGLEPLTPSLQRRCSPS